MSEKPGFANQKLHSSRKVEYSLNSSQKIQKLGRNIEKYHRTCRNWRGRRNKRTYYYNYNHFNRLVYKRKKVRRRAKRKKVQKAKKFKKKNKPCRNYHFQGYCKYGSKCFFQHDTVIALNQDDIKIFEPNPLFQYFSQYKSEPHQDCNQFTEYTQRLNYFTTVFCD